MFHVPREKIDGPLIEVSSSSAAHKNRSTKYFITTLTKTISPVADLRYKEEFKRRQKKITLWHLTLW